jgi:hypothetical protein
MQDDPTRTAAEEENDADAAVLRLLVAPGVLAPLSIDEVAAETGLTTLAVTDAVNRLHGAGLAHKCEHFVFATVAARRFDELS